MNIDCTGTEPWNKSSFFTRLRKSTSKLKHFLAAYLIAMLICLIIWPIPILLVLYNYQEY